MKRCCGGRSGRDAGLERDRPRARAARSAASRRRTRRRSSRRGSQPRAARRSGTAASCRSTPCFLLVYRPAAADLSRTRGRHEADRRNRSTKLRRGVTKSAPIRACRGARDRVLRWADGHNRRAHHRHRADRARGGEDQGAPGRGARRRRRRAAVAVQGGGCSGFEYALGFDRGAQEGDHELEALGVRVVVDPFSAPYLQGAQIDFLDGLQESGFKIENPNVVLGLRLRPLVPGRGRARLPRRRARLRLRLLALSASAQWSARTDR